MLKYANQPIYLKSKEEFLKHIGNNVELDINGEVFSSFGVKYYLDGFMMFGDLKDGLIKLGVKEIQ